ncbi:hypothetical protein [Streptomyces sp. NBRC 109706]|uniref:hypothetical protein n=1 Tax=Streptomyces sp. NBRC 109706 TaxID=1550035 RepID=UPI00083548CC|nr:hypothetical protein [Streptomyces sp. NBRC 109706]
MAFTPCADPAPADWIVSSELPWQRLVGFGPAGFPSYARLRFLPDPVFEGQSEADVEAEGPSEDERLRMLFDVLAAHTRTPDDCYFCLWDGYGDIPDGGAGAARVVVPARSYLLFRGSLTEAGGWGAGPMSPGPALAWPADRAWCVANDVDPHWAGIGAASLAVAELVGHPHLDVTPADPTRRPPVYL